MTLKSLRRHSSVLLAAAAVPALLAPVAPPAQALTAKPLTGKTIVVDAGHTMGTYLRDQKAYASGTALTSSCTTGGTWNAKAGYPRYPETTFNYDVALRTKAALEAQGATVVLTRTSNSGTRLAPCLRDRDALIKRVKPSLVLSLHGDGSLLKGARGFHIIVAGASAGGSLNNYRSRVLAKHAVYFLDHYTAMPRSNYIATTTGSVSTRTNLWLMNRATVPTILVEAGNMRNTYDGRLQRSSSFRQSEAHALALAVVRYYRP